MPEKGSTQTYSSEDAPQTDEDVITVYYCKYSGDPVLITVRSWGKLPKRRTDGARVLDTEKYTVRLKAQPEVKAKLIKREGGKLEKQYRYLMGNLPVCYKSEPEGKYLYLIDGALSAFNFGNTAGEGGETPVPPCIQQTASGMIQIAIDVEDKARTKAVSKITADEVESRSPNQLVTAMTSCWSSSARCCISDCRRCRCCEVGARVPSC